MRVAIIGGGISGLLAAYLLSPDHDITVFEANGYIGGHTHTVPVTVGGETYAVDTGFIVFNDWPYPNFIKLPTRLGVASQPSSRSFSARCERTGLEYNGTSLNTLFAQRRNLLRPPFHCMVCDILRFNRTAPTLSARRLSLSYSDSIYSRLPGVTVSVRRCSPRSTTRATGAPICNASRA